MPSPSPIPRSSSDPYISSFKAKSKVPPSNHSACSAQSSSKFSYWTHWSNINKLGNLILPGRKSSDSSSKHSDLTEEGLQAHNERHAFIPHQNIKNVDQKNAKCSPYYKGLTDASLVIHRIRNPSSPGRESHATTVAASTSSSLSSFIAKMQEWSSCLTFKPTTTTKGDAIKHTCTSSSSSVSSALATKNKASLANLERKEISDLNAFLVYKEKPLRERVSEQPPPPPQPPPPAPLAIGTKKANEREFIWANKYQPKTLKDFICNRDRAIQLQGMMREGFGHFIFEGPPGVGKRTMISAMLREAFGPDSVQTKEERKAFNLKGEAIGSIQVNVKESFQHVEVNLSDLKGYEKHVVVELIKDTTSKISNKSLQSNPDNCRAIILYEADKLSTDVLLYIRWLLERYKGCNTVFFCCSDVSKLQPIKILCTVVQLSPPSKEEIVEVLEYIAKQEGIELPRQLAEKIAENSKNNLRQAIRSFEASWRMSYPFKEDQEIMTGWEEDIANIAKDIVEEQSPKQLYIIRGKLQNLTDHNVSPDFIFKSLVGELKKLLDEPLQHQVDTLYEEYNRDDGGMCYENPTVARNRHEEGGKKLHDTGRKNVQHFLRIEEFIAKFMSLYKLSTTNTKSVQRDSSW